MDNNSYRRLMRSTTDRRIAGVCGGIAKYLNVDPTVVRIIFLVALL
ncbi:MAG: PspC domain-containing protein, partial [Bacteroidales bacterium]|nr:PspC domain-containing protein [Bacteroidales bacterium]